VVLSLEGVPSRDAGGYTPLIGGPFPGPGGSGYEPGGRTGVAGVEGSL